MNLKRKHQCPFCLVKKCVIFPKKFENKYIYLKKFNLRSVTFNLLFADAVLK